MVKRLPVVVRMLSAVVVRTERASSCKVTAVVFGKLLLIRLVKPSRVVQTVQLDYGMSKVAPASKRFRDDQWGSFSQL